LPALSLGQSNSPEPLPIDSSTSSTSDLEKIAESLDKSLLEVLQSQQTMSELDSKIEQQISTINDLRKTKLDSDKELIEQRINLATLEAIRQQQKAKLDQQQTAYDTLFKNSAGALRIAKELRTSLELSKIINFIAVPLAVGGIILAVISIANAAKK
jgi:hypothetical protein